MATADLLCDSGKARRNLRTQNHLGSQNRTPLSPESPELTERPLRCVVPTGLRVMQPTRVPVMRAKCYRKTTTRGSVRLGVITYCQGRFAHFTRVSPPPGDVTSARVGARADRPSAADAICRAPRARVRALGALGAGYIPRRLDTFVGRWRDRDDARERCHPGVERGVFSPPGRRGCRTPIVHGNR